MDGVVRSDQLAASTPRFIIYALIDPRTGAVRYVGKSSSGLERPRDHARCARGDTSTHCARWIRQLQAFGLTYEIVVLEVASAAAPLGDRERWWIAFARAWGCSLTNLTDGGDGSPGYAHTAETKALLSATTRAALTRPEVLARHRAVLMRPDVVARRDAVLALPEVRARHLAASRAARIRPEVRAKLSASIRALRVKEYAVPGARAAFVAMMQSPEVAAKRRAATKHSGKTQAETYRRMIASMPDATNAQIYAAMLVELGEVRMDSIARVSRRVSYYRWQMRSGRAPAGAPC